MARDPMGYEIDGKVCSMLLQKIEKPKGLLFCKAINVYDNKYRINLYTKNIIDESGLEGQRIGYSCFAKLDKDDLIIISQSPSGIAL